MTNNGHILNINDEVWKEAFLGSPQPMLIATADERLLHLNHAACELLNLELENATLEKIDCILGRLSNPLKKAIRVQRTLVEIENCQYLICHLQDTRDQSYSNRLLTFFATTLKALDNPSSLATSYQNLLHDAARLAVEDLCNWCRIDLRPDLDMGRGVVAHSERSLETLLSELQKINFENPDDFLSPTKVIRSGLAVFKEDVSEDLLQVLLVAPRTFALFQRMGLRSYICVPIKRLEDTIGCITFARSEVSLPFDTVDVMIAEEFAMKLARNIERALLYKKLAEMKDVAEAANRAKTNFLANVSHEIRTPLGAILGFSELLISSMSSNHDRHEWGNKIRSNSGHLLRLIDDILDLSKVEVGKLDLELRKFDLKKLLQDVWSFARSNSRGKMIEIRVKIVNPIPRFILSDETRLSQILSNVVGNAIKFTSGGFVQIQISACQIGNLNNHLISFEVSDSGIGVNRDQASLLFQPFTQADASHTRQFGGTGLGLALSRNLARGLGGDLILKDSEPGKGSTFELTILTSTLYGMEAFSELSEQEEPVPREGSEDDLSQILCNTRILLVEDSLDIQVLVKRFLEAAGGEVVLANNGEEGVRAAQSSKYDVVLMDVQMPVKDGCEAAQELRASGYSGLIVALTANAMKEEQDRCLAAGYDAHFSKPMRRLDLIQSIARLIQSQSSSLSQ